MTIHVSSTRLAGVPVASGRSTGAHAARPTMPVAAEAALPALWRTGFPWATPVPARLGPRPAAAAAGWQGSEQGWLSRPRICGGSRVPGLGPLASSPSWLRDWQPRSRSLEG